LDWDRHFAMLDDASDVDFLSRQKHES
jgi:hypothetical protein